MTEVVLRVGQPVSMRTASGPTDVTARALSSEQLEAIVRDTELAALMASRVQDAVIELQAGTLRVIARLTRQDDGITLTLTRAALPPQPRSEPPPGSSVEVDVDLEIEIEIEPPVKNASALANEPPVRRSVAIPPSAPILPGASPKAGRPPRGLGSDLDISLDDLPDPVDHGSPAAPVHSSPSPSAPVHSSVPRERNPAMQRIDPHAGSDRQGRQDLRSAAGAFQRVDLRDARAPTPTPTPAPAESREDASVWADIDLAPPTGKR